MQMSGLILLLPHGFEGQGPEHSSARLERYLQACAENNIQVVNPTAPSSIFHLLRRQVLRDFRKPLVVMTPKSLLRHKLAVSSLSKMDKGSSFETVIDDQTDKPQEIKRIVICSGKIYYDLFEACAQSNRRDVAIIRLEQLYPLPKAELKKIFARYGKVADIIWAQEEPENMGAWAFVRHRIMELLGGKPLSYAGRPNAASPAVGYMSVHKLEQEEIVNKAIGLK